MTVPLNVLLVEDSADDARLVLAQLHRDGWDVTHARVDTPGTMAAAIGSRAWDLVIADYAMPQFSALDALRMLRERGLDVPFILVSGAIGEEAAVQALKAGANDYLFKNNLSRLTSAIQRELRENQSIRRLQEMLEGVLNASIQGILVFKAVRDPAANGTIIDFEFQLVNPAAERLLKRSAKEIVGQRLLTILPGNRTQGLFDQYVELVANGIPLDLETHYRHDGLANWFRVTAVRVGDGFSVMFDDITARKRTDEALRESEARYRTLFECAHDGIVIAGPSAQLLDANPRICQMLGYTRDEMLLPQSPAIVAATESKGIKEAFDALQTRSDYTQEWKLVRKDGSDLDAEVIATMMPDGSLTAVIRDITERKRIDQQLARAKEAAEAANRSKSEFLANMSHEIRTPMTAILGFADMVVHKEQGKAERVECAQIIRRNALNLVELINEILDLSKIEASQMILESVSCDLLVLLSEIISLMRPRAVEKGLELDVVFDGGIPRRILTDPLRLRQILVNLVGNAVKFTDAGKITLRICDEGTGTAGILLRVDVNDTGIGMSPEQLNRLFQPFTQADESITRKFGGTGLGLTISKRLAKLLNGDITVITEPGIGSTFTLRVDGGPSSGIEMRHNLTEAMLPKNVEGEVKTHHTLAGRILLVDDGRDNQRLLRMLLTDAGAEVVSAENGQIAVEMATTQPFDMILMDMQMPVMDGYAATTELRRRGLTVPIIALTAHAMLDDRARCMACGCTYYLSKPIQEEALLTAVSHHLGNDRSITPAEKGDKAVAAAPAAAIAAEGSGRIKSRFAGDPRITKILPMFVDGLSGRVRKMLDLLESNDLAELQNVIHKLRGASGGYGFDAVTDPAFRAEQSIKLRKSPEVIAAEINSLIEIIRQIEGYDESKMTVNLGEAA